MKESTGELSMVVITLLAIALIATIVKFLVPLASNFINDSWHNTTSGAYVEPAASGDVSI